MKASITDENNYIIKLSGQTSYKISKSEDEYQVKSSTPSFYKSELISSPFVIANSK